jgi:ribosomal protein S18 acetylase RimI-like enzyme
MAGQGYDYMSLSCEKENEEAIAFWKAQGFVVKLEENARIHFAREI